MKIKKVVIKNFRSIKFTYFTLSCDLNSLAGGNESGKSNILLAIKKFLDKEDFSDEDQYQLAKTKPVIKVTFNDLTQEEKDEIKKIINIDSIEKLVFRREGNSYTLLHPNISHIKSENQKPEDQKNNEVDSKENKIQEKVQYLDNKTTEKIFQETPSVEHIRSISDLIVGRNLKIDELFMPHTDPDTDPTEAKKAANGRLETVRRLIEVGDIKEDDIRESDLSKKTLVLNKKASLIAKKLRGVWQQEDIKMRLSADNENLTIHFRDGKNIPSNDKEDDTKWIWTLPENRSDGFRWYVTFFARYLSAMKESDNVIFLIDDMGMPLNKLAQEDLINELKSLTVNSNIQIMYTTHSNFMINWETKNSILLAKKEEGEGTKIHPMWWTKFAIEELPSPLKEIGTTWASNLLGDKNIIVEGYTDPFVIHRICQIFSSDPNLNEPLKDYRVVPAGTASIMQSLGRLSLSIKKKTILLYDSDNEGLNYKSKAEEEKDFKNICLDINTLSSNPKHNIITIEDFLPKSEYIDTLNKYGVKYFKKRWKKISHLSGVKENGYIKSVKTWLKHKSFTKKEVNNFIREFKYPIINQLTNIIKLNTYTDKEQIESIKNFISNLHNQL